MNFEIGTLLSRITFFYKVFSQGTLHAECFHVVYNHLPSATIWVDWAIQLHSKSSHPQLFWRPPDWWWLRHASFSLCLQLHGAHVSRSSMFSYCTYEKTPTFENKSTVNEILNTARSKDWLETITILNASGGETTTDQVTTKFRLRLLQDTFQTTKSGLKRRPQLVTCWASWQKTNAVMR